MSTKKILFPTNIDRWTKPVVTKLREISLNLPQYDFYSFSSPENEEDMSKGVKLWKKKHIKRINYIDLLTKKYDVTHITSTGKRIYLAVVSQKLMNKKNKCVFTIPIELKPGDRYFDGLKKMIERADCNVAISQSVANTMNKYLNKEADYIIGNGVDVDYFNYSIVQKEKINKEKNRIVLFVGFMSQRKRPDIFIELAKRMKDIQFVMIGGIHNQEDKLKYIGKVNAQNNIKYLGLCSKETVRLYMAKSSVLIFPSEYEGMSSTVLEASAMGMKILARPVSSLPEVIEVGTNGWLYNIEDLDMWKSKIQEILSWNKLKQELEMEKSRDYIIENFSWQSVADKYSKVYNEL